MKNKIYIFGGAFNPPTIAHLQILQAICDQAKTGDRVMLLPSGNRSDKAIVVLHKKRLEYLEALINSLNTSIEVFIDTSELSRGVLTNTVDTHKLLNREYSGLVWVFGADSLQTIGSWSGGAWLMQNICMLAVKRQGSEYQPENFKDVKEINVDIMQTSSTEVRRRCAANEPIAGLVPELVAQILDDSLYE